MAKNIGIAILVLLLVFNWELIAALLILGFLFFLYSIFTAIF